MKTDQKTAEEIWDKHFKGWTMAGQIKRQAIPAMEQYASQFKQPAPLDEEGVEREANKYSIKQEVANDGEYVRLAKAYVVGYKAAQSHQQWVDVKERLPESGYRYNVVIRSETTRVDIALYNGDGVWYCYGEKVSVTHWQPLPKSPPQERSK